MNPSQCNRVNDTLRGSVGSISIQLILSKIVIFDIVISWQNSNVNTILYRSKYRIIENPISKIFSLFAKFYMMIFPGWLLNRILKHFIENIEALILKIGLS